MADVGCPAQDIEGSGVENRSRGVEKAGSFAAEIAATERLLPVFMCRVVPKAGSSALGLAEACVRSSIHGPGARPRTALVAAAARFISRGLRL
jgi:hypothetical protein